MHCDPKTKVEKRDFVCDLFKVDPTRKSEPNKLGLNTIQSELKMI